MEKVLFISSKEIHENYRSQIKSWSGPIWILNNIMTAHEVEEYRNNGCKITVFTSTNSIDTQNEFNDLLEIIQEHHPKLAIVLK